MKRYLVPVWLVILWVLLWRDLSVANVVGGVLVAAVLCLIYPLQGPTEPDFVVRLGRVIRFAGYVLFLLVTSNVIVGRAVVSRWKKIETGIVELPLPNCPRIAVTVISNVIALTPGTLPIKVAGSGDDQRIYVHVLHTHHIEVARRDMHRLVRMGLDAMVVPEVVREFEEAVDYYGSGTDSSSGAGSGSAAAGQGGDGAAPRGEAP